MHCARRHVDGLPGSNRDAIQHDLDPVGGERFLKSAACRAGLESQNQRGAGIGVQDVPHLGLAQLAVLVHQRIFIIGMNLQREVLLSVQQFHQQRELPARQRPARARTHQLLPEGIQDRRQRLTFPKPAIGGGRAVRMAGDLPAFRHGAGRQIAAVQRRQPASAPEIVAQNRCEGQGVNSGIRHQIPGSFTRFSRLDRQPHMHDNNSARKSTLLAILMPRR